MLGASVVSSRDWATPHLLLRLLRAAAAAASEGEESLTRTEGDLLFQNLWEAQCCFSRVKIKER